MAIPSSAIIMIILIIALHKFAIAIPFFFCLKKAQSVVCNFKEFFLLLFKFKSQTVFYTDNGLFIQFFHAIIVDFLNGTST